MIKQDQLRRFLFEDLGIRGEWVSLASSWQAVKQHQTAEPDFAQAQLGQALAALVMLSATIKFNGSIILQAQGDGAIKTLVAQSTHDYKIRGLVRSHGQVMPESTNLFGKGYMAVTIKPESGEPYQGIVPIDNNDITGALEYYFAQSEQLPTRLWLHATDTQAVGLLLQQVPGQNQNPHDWERIEILADTLTANELLSLDCEDVLYRLFNEEKIRLFEPAPITFACTCSVDKISTTLRALGREELESILLERECIEVNCDFCNAQYRFDKIDVELLLSHDKTTSLSPTQH